jgi:hypothetical protein
MLGLILITFKISFGQPYSSSLIKTYNKTLNQSDEVDSATIFVSYIVETTGKITNVEVSKIHCRKCSKGFIATLKSEAKRVVKSMHDLEPPKERIRYILPITFMLID